MRVLGIASPLVLVCALTAGVARAQPGLAPVGAPPMAAPAPGPVAGEKSENTAVALSLGVTLAGVAMTALVDDDDGSSDDDIDGVLALGGSLAFWFGPTTGHWYAGNAWSTGLTVRFVGAGAVVLGAVMLIDNDCFDCGGADGEGEDVAVAFLVGGSLAIVGGAVYDIATAPGAVRRHNDRLRARAGGGWAVTPTLGRDRAGLALAGSF